MSTDTSAVPMVRIPRSANPVPTPTRRVSRRVPAALYAAGSLMLITVLIAGAKQVGWFATSGRVDPATGQAITLTAESTGADLKGWMTIEQFLDAFGLDKAAFYAEFGLPADVPTSEKLGPLGEAVPGFELEQLRTWVDARAAAGAAASAVVEPTTTSTGASTTSLGTPVASATGTPNEDAPRDGSGEGLGGATSVRGSTTLDQLVEQTGASRAELERQFGIAAGLPGDTRLRDLISSGALQVEISEIRTWAEGL